MIASIAMKLILASGSPRRRKIMAELGYDFDVIPANVSEDLMFEESPKEHVLRLSRIKAESVAVGRKDDLVIGADTIVVLENRILGKPESEKQASEMLEMLSGKMHTVFTGLTLIHNKENYKRSDFDFTEVTFNDLSEAEVREYINTGEPLDKAGSYGIQGMGSFLVNNYRGELDTVIGFPSKLFEKMYQEVLSCQNL